MNVLMWEHFAPGGPIRVGGHHFARLFLRMGARVAWCAGPLSPVNFIKRNDETRARLRLWRRGGAWLEDGRLFAYAPMTLLPYRPYPVFDRPGVARRTLRYTLPGLRTRLLKAGFGRVDILWMSPGSPFLALLDELPHDLSVYRMSDDTALFPDAPRSFARLEEEALSRCDLVIATARRLERRARSLGARRVMYLPNACEPEPFAAEPLAEPADVATLGRPRAVYAGAIDSWFDADLVAGAARALPRWEFVLIGPVRADLRALAGSPNVRVLGPRPYCDLPAYLRHADAGIVPFRITPMTQAIHPIKVYEYCAAGLPVVATPMEETVEMDAPLRLARDAEGFARALEAGLGDGPGERTRRLAYARANTWDGRFERVLSEIADLERARRVGAGGGARAAVEARAVGRAR
jgi:glycosyltransferase involved in cell wall biosynthesis